jgi:alpha-tubulin suppressor-like RCC1 family protein
MDGVLAPGTLAGLVVLLAACGDSTAPTPPTAGLALAVGGQHACAVTDTATRCWGAGSEGQLGIGLTPADTTPVPLSGAPEFILLTGGSSHTCGLDGAGAAFCWGSNADGQLGISSGLTQCPLPCATTPQPVAGDLRFRSLAAGADHTCGITTGGAAFCWGLNDLGQLGTTGTTETCLDGPCARIPAEVETAKRFTAVTAALNHSCALESGGVAYCWGFQAGTTAGGNRIPQYRPQVVAVPGGIAFRQISAGGWHTCGVALSGSAYCWGIDALGAGPSVLESDEPVAVGDGHRFKAVYSAGSTSCGLDLGGVAYCWGPNSNGAVGTEPTGSTVRFDLPTPVSGGLHFVSLAPGQSTYCGITTAEMIACWGRGTSGELGTGHQDSSQPVSLPAASTSLSAQHRARE